MVRQIMNDETVDVNETETYDNNKMVVLKDYYLGRFNEYEEVIIRSGISYVDIGFFYFSLCS